MKLHKVSVFAVASWMSCFCFGSTHEPSIARTAENSGVVVKNVVKGSEAERIGLREGDIVLRWNRGGISGPIRSPFDLSEVDVEQVPRGTVRLEGTRGSERLRWTLGSNPLGADVRPALPDELLAKYREGEKFALDGHSAEAAASWRAASRNAKSTRLRAWLLSRAAESLAIAQDWTGVDQAYRSAILCTEKAQTAVAAQLFEKWAGAYETRKDWDNAVRYYKRALLENEHSAPDSLKVAADLQHLAWIARQQHNVDLVAKYAQRSYAIRKRLAPGSLVLAATLDHLAGVAWDRADLAGVERLELEALRIRNKLIPDSRDVARVLSNLGAVALQRGDLPKAEDYDRQALAIEQKLAPDSLNVAMMLNNLGLIASDRGDLAKAEGLHSQALAIRDKQAPESRDMAMSLGNLGLVAESRGDLAKAEAYQRRALAIEESLSPGSRDSAATLTNLGNLLETRGDLDEAADYYRRALIIEQKQAPDSLVVAQILVNLGDIAQERRDPIKADDYFNQSLAIRTKQAPDSLYVAESLSNLGVLAEDRDNWEGAKARFQQALAIRQRLAPGGLDSARSLNDLGHLFSKTGDLTKAEEYYSRALSITDKLAPAGLEQVDNLAGLAQVAQGKGQPDHAAELYDRALAALENQTARSGGVEEERMRFRGRYADYFLKYVDLLVIQKKADLALQVLERFRARSLLMLLEQARVDIRQGIDPGLLQRELALQQELDSKSGDRLRLRAGKHSESDLASVNRAIAELLTQLQHVREEILERNPSYAALRQPKALDLKAFQQDVLDPDTVLLEYSLGSERSYLWVVSQTTITAFEIPKRVEIEAAARRLYRHLANRSQVTPPAPADEKQLSSNLDAVRYQEDAAALSRMLLAPVAQHLKAKRLLIVSDGALQYIPFAILPIPETETGAPKAVQSRAAGLPLLAEHEIINLPSASVLAVLRQARANRKSTTKAVAVLADPVFDKEDPRVRSNAGSTQAVAEPVSHVRRNESAFDGLDRLTRSVADTSLAPEGRLYLPRLPFTREEAEAILAATPAGEGMKAVDFKASRQTVTGSELQEYRIVHFATHGVLDTKHPELSGLILSLVDENGLPVNGFLELQDIYNLNLRADLVVLSACASGLGQEIKGEGLVGLTRGFMYAGASRVVASLWQVDDLATAKLMKRFYMAMEQEGMPPSAALRQAQLAMQKEKNWSAPYYWAAFQLQGDWR